MGAIYAVSYSYHTSLIEQDEREAEEKKKALDEKKKRKKAAAATKTKVESTDAEAAKAESKVSKPRRTKRMGLVCKRSQSVALERFCISDWLAAMRWTTRK